MRDVLPAAKRPDPYAGATRCGRRDVSRQRRHTLAGVWMIGLAFCVGYVTLVGANQMANALYGFGIVCFVGIWAYALGSELPRTTPSRETP